MRICLRRARKLVISCSERIRETDLLEMNLRNLKSDSRDAIVDVLARAFHDYPAMQYFLKVAGKEYDYHLHILNGYYTDDCLQRGWPVIGIHEANEISAVALVSPPLESLPEPLPHLASKVRAVLGESAWNRVNEFDRLSHLALPSEPHHFIGMLAVHPDHQGSGLGTRLVEHMKEMSVSEQSRGVTLTTETERNVEYYTRLGFEILGETEFCELTSWSMRWENNNFQNRSAE
ncbi:MAG: GNAT family N-acetyltransferase [Bacteroidetes bacterium]|nr:MAG: GNAT family N-acetyltransferase [Bacteroidota bacterium]